MALLKSKHQINHIDVVIANAGIANYWATAVETPIAQFKDHLDVNTTGTLILFQAVYELLNASKNPKFIPIGTPVGSIGEIEQFPLASTAYGTSKAALNFLTRKLHFEHPNMTIYPLSPGWVVSFLMYLNLIVLSAGYKPIWAGEALNLFKWKMPPLHLRNQWKVWRIR